MRQEVVLVQQYSPTDEDNNNPRTLSPGTDRRAFNVLCNRCNKWGHCTCSYTELDTRDDFSSLQFGFILDQIEQKPTSVKPKGWILLDSCSMDYIFNDAILLTSLL